MQRSVRDSRGKRGERSVEDRDSQEGKRRGMLGERIFMPGDVAKFSFSRL